MMTWKLFQFVSTKLLRETSNYVKFNLFLELGARAEWCSRQSTAPACGLQRASQFEIVAGS